MLKKQTNLNFWLSYYLSQLKIYTFWLSLKTHSQKTILIIPTYFLKNRYKFNNKKHFNLFIASMELYVSKKLTFLFNQVIEVYFYNIFKFLKISEFRKNILIYLQYFKILETVCSLKFNEDFLNLFGISLAFKWPINIVRYFMDYFNEIKIIHQLRFFLLIHYLIKEYVSFYKIKGWLFTIKGKMVRNVRTKKYIMQEGILKKRKSKDFIAYGKEERTTSLGFFSFSMLIVY